MNLDIADNSNGLVIHKKRQRGEFGHYRHTRRGGDTAPYLYHVAYDGGSNEIRIAAFMALLCSLACQSAFAAGPSGAPVARTNDSFPVLIQVDAAQAKAE